MRYNTMNFVVRWALIFGPPGRPIWGELPLHSVETIYSGSGTLATTPHKHRFLLFFYWTRQRSECIKTSLKIRSHTVKTGSMRYDRKRDRNDFSRQQQMKIFLSELFPATVAEVAELFQ